jgi:UDP-N-acetylglucosamine 2-epimerase (non-hydrolysing)
MKKIVLVFGTRPEAGDAGTVKLVGTDANEIITNMHIVLTNSSIYNQMSQAHNPYGDGKAGEKIACFFKK